MKIILSQEEIDLLKIAGITFDSSKNYSDDEALDLLELVREKEVSLSQYHKGHEEKLFIQYGNIADRIQDQIPEE